MRAGQIFLFFILLLSSAGFAVAGEKQVYKDLPGVKSPEQRLNEKTPPTCTSGISSFYDESGRIGMPVRVYNCGDGQLTFQSTEPPLGIRPVPDPYVHGEKTIKLSGSR